eukprot:scaffold1272_cov250-Pinguiococcus_pyrenoidosus.AAC.56
MESRMPPMISSLMRETSPFITPHSALKRPKRSLASSAFNRVDGNREKIQQKPVGPTRMYAPPDTCRGVPGEGSWGGAGAGASSASTCSHFVLNSPSWMKPRPLPFFRTIKMSFARSSSGFSKALCGGNPGFTVPMSAFARLASTLGLRGLTRSSCRELSRLMSSHCPMLAYSEMALGAQVAVWVFTEAAQSSNWGLSGRLASLVGAL